MGRARGITQPRVQSLDPLGGKTRNVFIQRWTKTDGWNGGEAFIFYARGMCETNDETIPERRGGRKEMQGAKSIMSVAVMKRAKREGMKVDGEMERTIKTGLERWRFEKKVVGAGCGSPVF